MRPLVENRIYQHQCQPKKTRHMGRVWKLEAGLGFRCLSKGQTVQLERANYPRAGPGEYLLGWRWWPGHHITPAANTRECGSNYLH